MNDKEKKAVEIIKKEITRPYKTPLEVYITDIKMLLHLMEKQEKVIDKMAGYINKAYNDEEQFYVDFEKNICEKTKNPQSESSDCYVNIYVDNACEECIKQYFYRKAEEDVKDKR